VGHFGFDHFLEFSMLFRQFLHMSFKCHRAHLIHERVAIEP
jgi:hypothetical protein